MEEQWTAVDRYITDQLVPSDAALDAALASSAANGLPAINVAPEPGKAAAAARPLHRREAHPRGGDARRVQHDLYGARHPPGRQVITLEYEPKHADVARANIERAGLAHVVEIRLGKAIDSLPKIAAERGAPFDFVFIDADKPGNADYFAWAMKLTRVGSSSSSTTS